MANMQNMNKDTALQIAHTLSGGKLIDDSTEWADTLHAAAAELRHQHARITELEDVADMAIKRIAELESQLSAIGAGGVEPLRKQATETSNDILTMADALIIQRTADARDAARYRWLRDNDWRNDEKMEPVIRLHLNAIWDEKIDEAMAVQARNKKGIEQ